MTTDLAVSQDLAVKAIAKTVLQHHVVPLKGKKYVTVAGATAIASVLGYHVREAEGGSTYVPKTEHLEGHWMSVAEVVDPDGAVVGRGTGRVFDDESPWSSRPKFARAAMASTRAAGRALRLAVGHLFTGLGDGVQATTLEEMPEDDPQPAARPALPSGSKERGEYVDPEPGAEGGRFTGVLSKVWPPREGKKGIGVEVKTPSGVVKLGAFSPRVIADCGELEGSDVEVTWRRNGQWLNLEGLVPISKSRTNAQTGRAS